MFGFDKKKTANSCIVPQNSAAKLEQKQHVASLKENHYERDNMNKCPHCENMAKNFLYLESLIRNNCDKNQKCSLCQSSLKYLQYVNRNIMQVFGNFDSIVRAARVFSSHAPPTPKYAVKTPQIAQQPQQQAVRAKGGALLKALKSAKSLKAVKSQKSKKSIKSSKSGKSVSFKSNKNKSKTSKGRGHIGHGKMVLKSKFKSKPAKSAPKLAKQMSKVVRSASQYQNLRSIRSKLSGKSKKQKKLQHRIHPQPVSINWNLLKRNMPKRVK
ncbi:hypothetical protein KR044_009825 [Drosophila immigrans]|nr:hypothetical protein KR044_009825 [Drosophila immigrans]